MNIEVGKMRGASQADVIALLRKQLAETNDALADTDTEVRELQAERDGLAAQVQAILDVRHSPRGGIYDNTWYDVGSVDEILAQSPADALAAHDSKVRAQALRDAADELDEQFPTLRLHGISTTADWLRARAAREDDTNGDGA